MTNLTPPLSVDKELLPCPARWCSDSKPALMQGGFRNSSYVVRCETCGCETPRYYEAGKATAAWNTTGPAPSVDKELPIVERFDYVAIWAEARRRYTADATCPIDITETVAKVAWEYGAAAALARAGQ